MFYNAQRRLEDWLLSRAILIIFQGGFLIEQKNRAFAGRHPAGRRRNAVADGSKRRIAGFARGNFSSRFKRRHVVEHTVRPDNDWRANPNPNAKTWCLGAARRISTAAARCLWTACNRCSSTANSHTACTRSSTARPYANTAANSPGYRAGYANFL